MTTDCDDYKPAKTVSNVGIKAAEVYFPNQYVSQAELEEYDNVGAGKYTIGLGLAGMGYCDDREDIYSITLSAVSSLLRKYEIDPNTIGRLEVGTETIIDKSKSVKSVLTQLFPENHDIEGIDTINACYGGTNALFNAYYWIHSPSWDGRNAIVVCGDIALYAKGNARPTGGAGVVAMLIGPDAPLVLDPIHASYMDHAYDFYKPNLSSEYPVVNGHFSVSCYIKALDQAYRSYLSKKAKHSPSTTLKDVNGFDYFCFHAPTVKQTAKAYGRLFYNDYILNKSSPAFSEWDKSVLDMDYETSLVDKSIEKLLVTNSKSMYQRKVEPSVLGAKNIGNSYTASLYFCLFSLLSKIPARDLTGKTIGMFSYGSGLASSIFTIKVAGDVQPIVDRIDLANRLESRHKLEPKAFEDAVELRHQLHLNTANYQPKGSIDLLAQNAFYLTSIDNDFRRQYAQKQ